MERQTQSSDTESTDHPETPSSSETLLRDILAGRITRLDGDQGALVIHSAEAERRTAHIRTCLHTVQTVSKMLVRESDPRTLLTRVCQQLVDSGTYADAWIALTDRHGWVDFLATSKGLEKIRGSLLEALRRDTMPYCARRALAETTPVTILDPGTECGDCPLAMDFPGLARLSHGLTFSERVYGIISVSTPKDYQIEAEERSIFAELAEDLAFTLYKLENKSIIDENTTRYRCLFENSMLPMLLIDPASGTVQDANPGALTYYGWSRSELIGRPVSSINTLTTAQVQAEMADAVARRRNHFNFRHRRADGSIRDVQVHSGPIETTDKTLLFSIIIDVTKQRQQQRDLEDTRYVLEEAQQIAQIGHFDMDVNADTWSSSSILDSIFGIDATFLRTKASWFALVHPEDRATLRMHLNDTVLRHHRPFDLTYRVRRHGDGATRWVHGRGRLSLDAYGRPSRVLGTIQDVSDQESAYLRLNNTIRDLQLAQRIAGMGNWHYNPVPRTFQVSEQFCRIMRIPMVRGMLARPAFLALLAPDDQAPLAAALDAASQDRATLDYTARVSLSDGSQSWLHFIGQADPEKGPSGSSVRGIVQDITALEQARLELQEAKDAAVAANRTKSEFLANVSHEIRTPLNAVIGFAETMAREVFGPIDNPMYKTYCQDILAAGHDLLALVSDIIDLSRIEYGALDLTETWLDLTPLIHSVLRIFDPRLKQKHIALTVDIPETLPLLFADNLRVRQILGNLLSNALKFTPDGGTITVACSVSADGGHCINIIDTGIGIPPNQIDQVMSVFGRASDAYVRTQDGAGLGLPLSVRLAMLHGGSLTLDSTPDQGTTVTVRFPPSRTDLSRSQKAEN